MVILGIGVVCAVLLIIRIWRQPGRAYNGLFLLVALFFCWLGAVLTLSSIGLIWAAILLIGIVVFLGPIAVIVVSIWLMVNGLIVMRREGISFATILPLVFGLGSLTILASPFFLALLFPNFPGWVAIPLIMVMFIYGYLGMQLVAYSAYAVLYSKLPKLEEVDAVVILGARLSKGYWPSPLLVGRLARGLQVRDEQMFKNLRPPVMVTSGGQGKDEQRAEAVAMAQWLEEQSVPAEQIIVELNSRTTEENLRNSAELMAARQLKTVIVATSNYHVLRTAALVRKLKLNWQVVGTKTASYYAPTAFLREFIAHLSYAWRWHVALILFIGFGLIALAAFTPLIR